MGKEIKVKYLDERCKMAYATAGSVAMDMRANIHERIVIKTGEVKAVPLGVCIDLEEARVGMFIYVRSGMARKYGMQLMNSVGVIDSDFRGEINAMLYNTGATGTDFVIEPFDRVAQCIFVNTVDADIKVVEELQESVRGTGGYGSTGNK